MGPRLTVRITRCPDTRAALVLTRENGTTTSGSLGAPEHDGAVHDLAHVVVERALELSEGHLGLVAAGWDLADLAGSGRRAALPAQAVLARAVAERISAEEIQQRFSSASEFRDAIREAVATREPAGVEPPAVPEEILTAMRVELADLVRQWELLAPGEWIELAFVSPRRATHTP